MVGSLNSAMPTALLAVRVEVAYFDGIAASILPLDYQVGVSHMYPFSQR
jgi:hypothetical protein